MGSSRAQREVVKDTLLVVMMRESEVQKVKNLIDKRLHRRPSRRDSRWLEALYS
ncbi:hypothetical protein SAMN03159495_4474 [Pseudomonas sp. NFR16]|nr:hypothetical protein SAMN03159495_4474 [Pseudomonas sp. NFR16]